MSVMKRIYPGQVTCKGQVLWQGEFCTLPEPGQLVRIKGLHTDRALIVQHVYHIMDRGVGGHTLEVEVA